MSPPVGKSVLIYACAFVAVGATPFLLLPLLTTRLTPQQFGQATSFLMLTTLLGNIAGLSAHGFVSVRWFKSEPAVFRSTAVTALAMIVATHALAALALLVAYPIVERVFDLPLAMALLAVLAATCVNLNFIGLAIFQSSGQPVQYLKARLVQGSLELALCTAMLLVLLAGTASRTLSYTAAVGASAAFGLALCWRQRHIGGRPQAEHLRSLARFGLPMMPHVVAGSAVGYIDRLVVSTVMGASNLGTYMAAMQVGMVMVALVEPLNKALAPWLFERLAKDDPAVKRQVVVRTYQFQALLVGTGVVVAVGATLFFDSIIGERFTGARSLIPWMVAGFVLQGMYYTVVNYLFYAEKTGRLSVVSACTAVTGAGISWILTSAYGLQGASWSFTINYALMFGLVWLVASRAVPMPWSLRRTQQVPST